MNKQIIFDDGEIKWTVYGRDRMKDGVVIDTNEYAISAGSEIMLLDPGGTEIFPYVLSSIAEDMDLKKITKFFCSHQDPDVFSSLPLWMAICPEAKIFLPWLWSGFISHYGKESAKSFVPVPDKGMEIELGGAKFQIVPAHYMHSSGNINLFDPRSRIFFSGDIGGALLPVDYPFWVEDFEGHIKYMQKFHERWMPSNSAKDAWVRRVRALKPSMICPQHGAIFKGDDVNKFLDWLETLEVGKLDS